MSDSKGIPSLTPAHNPAKNIVPAALALPKLFGGENPEKSDTIVAGSENPHPVPVLNVKPTAVVPPPVQKKQDVTAQVTTPHAIDENLPQKPMPAYSKDDKGNIWRNIVGARRIIGAINKDCSKAELDIMVAALCNFATTKE